MLTKEDKEWVTENFETKDALTAVATNVAELKVDSSLLQQAVQRLERGQEQMGADVSKILTIVQSFAGNVATLEQENKMGAVTLRRHDAQIHELATATGTSISK